ncbi:hypothetical protein D3C73_601560 [compost metagenome]
MPDAGLNGTNVTRLFPSPAFEHFLKGRNLYLIAQFGAGAVRLDIPYIVGRHSGHFHSFRNHLYLSI